MEKRTLIILTVAVLLLFGYPAALKVLYPNYHPEAAKPVSKAAPSPAQPAAAVAGTTPGAVLSGPAHKVSAGLLELTYADSGGGISAIALPGFIHSEKNKPIELFTARTTADTALVAMPIANGAPDISGAGAFTADGRSLTGAGQADGLRVERTLVFDGYVGKLTVTTTNLGSAERAARYALNVSPSFEIRHSIDEQYHEANFFENVDGRKKLSHIKEHKAGKIVPSAGPVEWAAMKDRHFSVIVKPADAGFTGQVEGRGDRRSLLRLISPERRLPPGGTATDAFTVFVGPTELRHVEPLGMGEIVNFGKMDWIGKLLVGLLEMLHKVCRNYGLAVILLTMLINIVLFPLTRQSFLSMKRMQAVQPQVKKLQEQHKNSPEKLHRETMELYKKHKVNPFGGCLPMLLQMPVFIALYVALSKFVDLVNAPFLWIKDLSSPDRLYIGVSLPVLGDHIHLLPLLMVAAMFIQQKFTMVTMEGQDPAMVAQQKMMAVMMPVLFGFIFYSMPSSLVLYWLTNTVLMSSYQFYLKRSHA